MYKLYFWRQTVLVFIMDIVFTSPDVQDSLYKAIEQWDIYDRQIMSDALMLVNKASSLGSWPGLKRYRATQEDLDSEHWEHRSKRFKILRALKVTNLTPLAHSTNLITLDLYVNKIRDVTPMQHLINLTRLDL